MAKDRTTLGVEAAASDNPSLTASEMTQAARLLLLVKENQLATAAVLFFAWQAGIFMEAWFVIQGVCAP